MVNVKITNAPPNSPYTVSSTWGQTETLTSDAYGYGFQALVTPVPSSGSCYNATVSLSDAAGQVTSVTGCFGGSSGVSAPTFFLDGNWSGTATSIDNGDSQTFTFTASVSQNVTQTPNTLSGTITTLGDGNVPVTSTVTGTVNGTAVTFTISSTDPTDTEFDGGSVTATIGTNGTVVTGSGYLGTGSMTWDGKNTLTGTLVDSDDGPGET